MYNMCTTGKQSGPESRWLWLRVRPEGWGHLSDVPSPFLGHRSAWLCSGFGRARCQPHYEAPAMSERRSRAAGAGVGICVHEPDDGLKMALGSLEVADAQLGTGGHRRRVDRDAGRGLVEGHDPIEADWGGIGGAEAADGDDRRDPILLQVALQDGGLE